MRTTLIFLTAVFVISGAVLAALLMRSTPPKAQMQTTQAPEGLQPNPLVSNMEVLPFSMTDQFGQIVTNDYFTGHITVMDFVFTHCPFICPTLTGRMNELSERVPDKRVQFLSISVDPERDTSETLADYARKNNADPLRWRFVSGRQEDAWTLVRDGLHFAVLTDDETLISLPNGSKMSNIVHPPWFVIVGPDGSVLDIINPMQGEHFEKLVQRVRSATDALRAQQREHH